MQVTVRTKLEPEDELDEKIKKSERKLERKKNPLKRVGIKNRIERLEKKIEEYESHMANDTVPRAVFGGRENLEKLKRGEITREDWKDIRTNQLYSIGAEIDAGNQNTRLILDTNKNFNRIFNFTRAKMKEGPKDSSWWARFPPPTGDTVKPAPNGGDEKPKTKCYGFSELYQAEVRKIKEMKEVILDKKFLKEAEENMPLYYMYRDVSKNKEDKRKIKEMGLRFDITIIPPMNLGVEFVKTAGHYHPFISIPHSNITYAEIYEVLEGKAHYLLQKRQIKQGKEKITDVVVIEAKKGEKVIIPPNYGHITINPSEETLKMGNWVARAFSSLYEPIRKKKGGAYFELNSGKFVKNRNYDDLPELRFLKPPKIKELDEGSMYNLIKKPEKLNFLKYPAKFKELFKNVMSP